MLKALWLASWYPNGAEATNGDFVQRHAIATSLFCKVDVIHVWEDEFEKVNNIQESSVQVNQNLSEKIIVFPSANIFPILNKLVNQYRFFSFYKKAIKQYIANNGLPNMVHVHVPMKAGMLALWMKRKYNIPFVVTEHWAIYNNYAPDCFSKRSSWFKLYTKKIILQAAAFLPVSEELGNAVNKYVTQKAFTTISNVADVNLFYHQPQKQNNKFRLVHVSSMIYQKNPQVIISAFEQLNQAFPETELVMIGPYSTEIETIALATGLVGKNIFFTGALSYAQVAAQLQQGDAFVLFSLYENLPCVIIEALCCGLPVIASAVGGIPELINETNGILTKSLNEKDLLNAMKKMVGAANSFNPASISAGAAVTFSYHTVGQKINDVYQSLI